MRFKTNIARATAMLTAVALLPTTLSAQDATAPGTEPSTSRPGAVQAPKNLAQRGTDPRVELFAKERGVSRDDAQSQLALTDRLEQQTAALASKFAGNYLTSVVEHASSATPTPINVNQIVRVRGCAGETGAAPHALPGQARRKDASMCCSAGSGLD